VKHAIGRLSPRRRGVNVVTTQVVRFGGAAVIAAIALIFFYLVWVVAPLFWPADVEPLAHHDRSGAAPVLVDIDDNSEIGLALSETGVVRFFDLETGAAITSEAISNTPILDAQRVFPGGNRYVVRTAAGLFFFDAAYAVSFPAGQRTVTPRVDWPFEREPLALTGTGSFDVHRTDSTVTIATLSAAEQLTLMSFTDAEPGYPLEFGRTYIHQLETAFDRVLFGARGQWLYLIADDGVIEVWDIRVPSAPQTAFRGRLVPEGHAMLALEPLVGRLSLLVADDEQRVTQWFMVRDEFGYRMVAARDFELDAAPLMLLAEARRKGFAVLDQDLTLELAHTTAHRITARAQLDTDGTPSVDVAALSPRADRLLLATGDTMWVYAIDNPHPDVSAAALWTKVWYEGYTEPVLSWQSSAADNAFEPKFSLTPLAFGTLKAAFYAMLFAMPVAIMGAIYTAYFMAPAMRRWVKPGIEVMAALPTVILGFLAGLWLAPLLEANLVGAMFTLATLPAAFMLFAWLWRFAPATIRRACDGWYGAIAVPVLAISIWLGFAAGPVLERLLFDGDAKAWMLAELELEFDQRNSLVVGIAMGLAVIPTIFSIAEEAIYGVPRHLINGSLALGATWWQTLVRVVLLTASPGIFSAVMIGMGRAVGETMIVLMATGNTAVMDLNIFQGMRTFSANIAVELPESEVGSTHYRVLFLAALVLFAITFVFNTVAELVRQRLRTRYGSL